MEAIATEGDSGSAAFIQNNSGDWKIAGVSTKSSYSNYGEEGEFIRLGSDFTYKWIQDNTADPNPGMSGPEIYDCSIWGNAG